MLINKLRQSLMIDWNNDSNNNYNNSNLIKIKSKNSKVFHIII